MKDIRKIIVPVDLLEHTDQLVEYASFFAKQFNAELHCIHVIEPFETYPGYQHNFLGEFEQDRTVQAEKLIHHLMDNNQTKVPKIIGNVIRGNIVDSIIRYTEKVKGDLIIIGTHGRKGLRKMWLGGVAKEVIKSAPCPTITCNPYKSET